jgi:hypothetical protein
MSNRSFSSSIAIGAAVAGVALSTLTPAVARAQGTQQDKTAAEALFQEGKRLMSEGKYSEGCPKLEESNKIDPGAGTLTALALCHRGEGKTATAWSEFKEVISLARRDNRKDREQVAQENVNELEPKLSRLTITLDRAAQQQGVEIKLDTTVIPVAMTGSPFPADPGVHKLTVSAKGFKARETAIEVGQERDEKTINVAPLESDGSAGVSGGVTVDGTSDAPKSNSTLRTASYIVGGVGAAGLVVGVISGLIAMSKHNDANCNGDVCPTPSATSKEQDAHSVGTISTIGFVAGGVLLAGGVGLYFFSSSSEKKSTATGAASLHLVPSAGPQGGFGSLVGRF